jgi:hypothetical protein
MQNLPIELPLTIFEFFSPTPVATHHANTDDTPFLEQEELVRTLSACSTVWKGFEEGAGSPIFFRNCCVAADASKEWVKAMKDYGIHVRRLVIEAGPHPECRRTHPQYPGCLPRARSLPLGWTHSELHPNPSGYPRHYNLTRLDWTFDGKLLSPASFETILQHLPTLQYLTIMGEFLGRMSPPPVLLPDTVTTLGLYTGDNRSGLDYWVQRWADLPTPSLKHLVVGDYGFAYRAFAKKVPTIDLRPNPRTNAGGFTSVPVTGVFKRFVNGLPTEDSRGALVYSGIFYVPPCPYIENPSRKYPPPKLPWPHQYPWSRRYPSRLQAVAPRPRKNEGTLWYPTWTLSPSAFRIFNMSTFTTISTTGKRDLNFGYPRQT